LAEQSGFFHIRELVLHVPWKEPDRLWREKTARENRKREQKMLWTIFVILLVLWLLGLVTSYTLGGFIHILLLLAVVVLVFNLISGRRAI
jgi:hypothetical protein